MSSEPKEGVYTYTKEGKTGKVRLELNTSPRGPQFWLIHYDQGWNPNPFTVLDPSYQPKFEILDEGPYTKGLIASGRLKLVKESFASAPTPVKAGRRRSRRKTRARKSRRYRK
jgi:hypothetical protein